MKKPICVHLDLDVVKKLDRIRGLIPRSTIIERLIYLFIESPDDHAIPGLIILKIDSSSPSELSKEGEESNTMGKSGVT